MEIDLDLDNYDLQDLFNLFSLNYNFTIEDLKNSKKRVMQTHPDKSKLDKKYFLFYCKAFRIIKSIYDFKNKSKGNINYNTNIEYLVESDDDKGKKLLVESLMKKDKNNFHEWFNETFDKINIIDEERKIGYGDWFKSEDDIDMNETSETNKNILHQKIIEKKEALSALTQINDIEASNNACSENYKHLGGAAPSSYSSDIFSKLPYEDLKKAHTETVVPVGEKDYNKVLKFNNVENLRQYRNSQNIKPMSNDQSKQYFNNKNNNDEHNNVQLAYKLVQQDEIAEKANKSWWNSLTLLK